MILPGPRKKLISETISFGIVGSEFSATKIDYLGSKISTRGISAEGAKNEKIHGQARIPNTMKQLKRLIGLSHFFSKVYS